MIAYHQTEAIPDPQWYARSIAQLRQRFPEDAPGFFGPGSMTWKIYREPGILIGSHRALLLQVAHPAIAAGVQIYSNFQKDYLGRAYRTFLHMTSIFFGSCNLALKAAGHLHQLHYRIKGSYTHSSGQQKAFGANDPQLLTWVLATLTDTSLVAYELLRPALSKEEKELFIRESQITAQLMGIPQGYYPESYEAFYTYYQEMLKGSDLYVGELAQKLSADILRGPFPVLQKLNRLFCIALLPPHLSIQYRLPQKMQAQKRFHQALLILGKSYNLLPDTLRYAPPYHQAQFRISRATQKKPHLLPLLFHHLGSRFRSPFFIPE